MLTMMTSLSNVCCELIDNIFTSSSTITINEIINSHKEILKCLISHNESDGYKAVNHHYDLVDKEILKWKVDL